MECGRIGRIDEVPSAAVARITALYPPVEQFRALTLHAEASDSLRAARKLVTSALDDWGLSWLADDAELVIGELVGNVVHHAVPDARRALPGGVRRIDVTLRKWPSWLLVGVADEDSDPPCVPGGELFSPELVGDFVEVLLPTHGRGLSIVQQLSDALWWVPEVEGGKTVCCRFDLDGKPRSNAP